MLGSQGRRAVVCSRRQARVSVVQFSAQVAEWLCPAVVEDPTSGTHGDKNATPSLALLTPQASHIYRPAPTGRLYKSHAPYLDLPQSTQHLALIRPQFLARANRVIKITQAAKDTANQRKSPRVRSRWH
ncbi:hypothetical protein K438DRAFT_1865975 [Mycena galopus ATCC 62051]|nr:hypothetical protein K438DRAFT_1865975 [Mycena galopus ATCC 62051]